MKCEGGCPSYRPYSQSTPYQITFQITFSFPAGNATAGVALIVSSSGNENGDEGVKAVYVRPFTLQGWLFIGITHPIFLLARNCSKYVT